MEQSTSWKADCHSACQEIPTAFMEAGRSLPCSQEPEKSSLLPSHSISQRCFL